MWIPIIDLPPSNTIVQVKLQHYRWSDQIVVTAGTFNSRRGWWEFWGFRYVDWKVIAWQPMAEVIPAGEVEK